VNAKARAILGDGRFARTLPLSMSDVGLWVSLGLPHRPSMFGGHCLGANRKGSGVVMVLLGDQISLGRLQMTRLKTRIGLPRLLASKPNRCRSSRSGG